MVEAAGFRASLWIYLEKWYAPGIENPALSAVGKGHPTILDNVDKSTSCVLAYKATCSFSKVSVFAFQLLSPDT